jgi:hypothetical protein
MPVICSLLSSFLGLPLTACYMHTILYTALVDVIYGRAFSDYYCVGVQYLIVVAATHSHSALRQLFVYASLCASPMPSFAPGHDQLRRRCAIP